MYGHTIMSHKDGRVRAEVTFFCRSAAAMSLSRTSSRAAWYLQNHRGHLVSKLAGQSNSHVSHCLCIALYTRYINSICSNAVALSEGTSCTVCDIPASTTYKAQQASATQEQARQQLVYPQTNWQHGLLFHTNNIVEASQLIYAQCFMTASAAPRHALLPPYPTHDCVQDM